MNFKRALLGAAVAALTPMMAMATPVQWAFNGHYYEYLSNGGSQASWDVDKALADAMTYNGWQGYLATITSADEDAFVHSVITNANNGGNPVTWVDGSDAAQEGHWVFTGGPEAGQWFSYFGSSVSGAYTHWNGGEPNNAGGSENYVELNWAGSPGWNDAGYGTPQTFAYGYVVEYSGTPEAGTWALMIAGFGGIGAMLRRSRKALAAA